MLSNLQRYAPTLDEPLRVPALRLPVDLRQQAGASSSARSGRSMTARMASGTFEPLPLLDSAARRFEPLPEPWPSRGVGGGAALMSTGVALSSVGRVVSARQTQTQTTQTVPTKLAKLPVTSSASIPIAQEGEEGTTAVTLAIALLDLVASQRPNHLFEWDKDSQRFQSRTSTRDEDTATWVSRPFLKTASMIKRTSAVLDLLRATQAKAREHQRALPRQLPALLDALREVLDWVRNELARCRSELHLSAGFEDAESQALDIVSALADELKTSFEPVLDALGELFNCSFYTRPPFQPLPGIDPSAPTPTSPSIGELELRMEPNVLLSYIKTSVDAIPDSVPPFVKGVMAFIFEQVSCAEEHTGRHQLGWPSTLPTPSLPGAGKGASMLSSSAALTKPRIDKPSPGTRSGPQHQSDIDSHFEEAMRRFDALPGSHLTRGVPPDLDTDERAAESRLAHFLASFSRPTVDYAPSAS